MVATPGRDEEKPNPMSIYSEMSGVRTLQKQMKAMGKRQRETMKKNYGQSAVKEMKRQASLSAKLNRRLRVFDYEQFQTAIEKMNEEMQTASEVRNALRATGGFGSHPYRDLIRSINIDRPSVDMTPSSEALAAMSKASYSGAHTPSQIDMPEPVVQPRGPEVGEASDEKLISELVDRERFVKCPDCGEADWAERMELVSAGEDATTDYKRVCRRCAISDIGYQ